ncbi:hypothetical protein V6N12_003119 [Hibiscus sabdariffa]|uniref:Uncharacterized protein n=1 Tax=Hibiscus sabdariffa TaxID=183260 RepID=A0ABR2EB11_9ROSI
MRPATKEMVAGHQRRAWSIGDGATIRFWKDNWITSLSPLYCFAAPEAAIDVDLKAWKGRNATLFTGTYVSSPPSSMLVPFGRCAMQPLMAEPTM